MKVVFEKTNNEVSKEDFVLIKGEFSPEDALEVINHLIAEKIRFHKLKSFSSEIRFGYVDKASLVRIEELMICKDAVKDVIQIAKKDGRTLNVSSTITIQII